MSYDVIMLAVLVGCILFGAWKGMAWQVASLSSLVLGYLAAMAFSEKLAPHIGVDPPLNRVAAMLALYVGTSGAVWVVFGLVAGFINRLKLKEFDRQLGALIGAGKGILLCTVITFFALMLSPQARDAILQSKSGHYIAVLIDRVDPLLPEEVHDVLGPYLHQLDEQLEPANAETPMPRRHRSASREQDVLE